MAPKRMAKTAEEGGKPKRQRKSLTLDVKMDIVKRKERGEGASAISRVLGLSQSTVWTVINKSAAIKKAGDNATTLQAKLLTKHREPIMDRMERLLKIWIDDQNQQHMPLSLNLICEKALSIIEKLKEEMGVQNFDFKASKGWFERFRRRSSLHNIKVTGEAASSDKEAADTFKPALEMLIEEKGYSKKQVINYDETGLYWKKMTSKTYIDKEEKTAKGFKVAKDRLTLLLGGNAEGDLKLKPLLIYHSENPRALKGLLKQYLPVIWKSNKKAWLTTSIHQDYFTSYVSPTLKNYAAANNIANRFLLLVDNAPSHPKCMEDWSDNIEVMFLPPNTTALIQPMDQTVIKTFKAYYSRRTMQQLIKGTDGPDKPNIKEWWKGYNIKHGLDNIKASWDEIKNHTMNAAWKKLWPACVNEFQGFSDDDISMVRKDIVKLSHKAGFNNVDDDDVQELLDSHAEPLTNEELIELEKAIQEAEKEEEEEEAEPVRGLDIKTLRECLGNIDAALETLQERDPNPARSGNVAHEVEKSLKIYREIYDKKRRDAKQSTISSFFKPANRATPATPADPALAGPSTSVTSTTDDIGMFEGFEIPASPSPTRLSPSQLTPSPARSLQDE